MNNNEFKTPLVQSLAVLSLGIVFFAFVVSSGAHGILGSIWAIIVGIFTTVLYLVGLALGITVCIGCLVGIFLVAVAMVNKNLASTMYSDLKENIAKKLSCSTQCIKGNKIGNGTGNFVRTLKNNTKIEKKARVSAPAPKPKVDDKISALEAEVERLQASERANRKRIDELSAK